jgi:threonine/homoserine/homoserine lactone efflux protein
MTPAEVLIPWISGAICGLLVSVPVGPINVTIVNEGAQRGFRWAFLIGLGSVVMEVLYCAAAFTGFSELFDSRVIKATMELISFLLVLFLGLKYLLAQSLPGTPKSAERIEKRLHPHTAFMIGFVRVFANPLVLLFWITLSATMIAHEWVDPTWASKGLFVAGVAVGTLVWFVLLSFIASRGHGKLSAQTLLRMSKISGAVLLLVACGIGIRLISLLYRYKLPLQ